MTIEKIHSWEAHLNIIFFWTLSQKERTGSNNLWKNVNRIKQQQQQQNHIPTNWENNV